MSDTPRTDAWRWSGGDDPMGEFYKFACQLERELDAANERVKRLEQAGNDVVWWFCQKESSQLSSMQSAALKQWRNLRGRPNHE